MSATLLSGACAPVRSTLSAISKLSVVTLTPVFGLVSGLASGGALADPGHGATPAHVHAAWGAVDVGAWTVIGIAFSYVCINLLMAKTRR